MDDHKGLETPKIREIFDALRTQTLALDPCVVEDVKKLYIAYKAETNFVDVITQASRLLVSLNIPFHELDEPRGICRDVANLGRWGNGDAEVSLDSMADIPYVMSLIGQALERQLGDTESE